MTFIICFCMFVGGALGLQYKILVLVPFSVVGVALTLWLGPAQADWTSTPTRCFVVIIALQAGYALGLTTRAMLARMRTDQRISARLGTVSIEDGFEKVNR